MAQAMGWRLLEHTADVGIEAEAPEPAACLAEAAAALSHVLTGGDPGSWRGELDVALRVEAPDLQALAVAFLAELVWLRDARDLLWQDGHLVVEADGEIWRVAGTMRAVRHDSARHGRGVEVKAVTYHQVMFALQDGVWRLRVYLDL
jgi:SHS2 domain-containing protein